MATPSEEDIANFMAITQLGRDEAIRRLKKSNSVEQAVNHFFDPSSETFDDNPDLHPVQGPLQGPDEILALDRNGENPNRTVPISNVPGIEVHSPDELGPAHLYRQFDGAPSRPPSRTTNNRSPLSRVIDLTVDSLNANPQDSKTYDEDEDFKRAIELSKEDYQGPQETGVTGYATGYATATFGPATREQYETGKWDLVPVSAQASNWEKEASKFSVQEILMDPEPVDRKREQEVPAFLRVSPTDHRLGALLTIYHEIPIIREIFLNRIDANNNYGANREWWNGAPIELSTVSFESSDTSEFTQELQRLMAFLDKSTRSYGSTAALEETTLVQKQKEVHSLYQDTEMAVMHAFQQSFKNQPALLQKLFSSVEGGDRPFCILDLPLPYNGSFDETIYDMADEALWKDAALGAEIPYLRQVADVITFRFTDWEVSNKIAVDVPAVWYSDRYLASARDAALDMRMKKQAVKEALQKISQHERRLTHHRQRVGNGMKEFNLKDLFKVASRHDEYPVVEDSGVQEITYEDMMALTEGDDAEGYAAGNAEIEGANTEGVKTEGVTVEGDAAVEDDDASVNTVEANDEILADDEGADQLTYLYAAQLTEELTLLEKRIDAKLLALNEEKEKAIQDLRELSKLYTEPSDDPALPRLHKYTLRGVGTNKHTMYICRRTERKPNLTDMDVDSEESSNQWWRIRFKRWGPNPVAVEKTSEEKVLEAAKTETKMPLLVYASEKAMQHESNPLPAALETFVQQDNRLFRVELGEEEMPSPKSPPKRKSHEMASEDPPRWSPGWSNGPSAAINSLAQAMPSDGTDEHEVLIGIEPGICEDALPAQEMQEMQEMPGMRMLSGRPVDGENTGDCMDMDIERVVADDNVAEESRAVNSSRQVEFVE